MDKPRDAVRDGRHLFENDGTAVRDEKTALRRLADDMRRQFPVPVNFPIEYGRAVAPTLEERRESESAMLRFMLTRRSVGGRGRPLAVCGGDVQDESRRSE